MCRTNSVPERIGNVSEVMIDGHKCLVAVCSYIEEAYVCCHIFSLPNQLCASNLFK